MGETRRDETADGSAVNTPERLTSQPTEEVDVAAPKPTTAPAFQHYPKDTLSRNVVQRMSLTEFGAYMKLQSLCWINGGLPAEPHKLAGMLGVKSTQFERMWGNVLCECFYTDRNGLLQDPVLDAERAKHADYRRRQSDRGKMGGRPSKPKATALSGFPEQKPEKAKALLSETKAGESSPISDLQSSTPVQSASHSVTRARDEPLDVSFNAFREAYPPGRRKGGWLAQQAYVAACDSAGGPDVLLAALRQHVASEQWQAPDKIPGMEKWLAEERWRQQLPAAKPVGVGITPRTAGNVESLRRFVNRGQS